MGIPFKIILHHRWSFQRNWPSQLESEVKIFTDRSKRVLYYFEPKINWEKLFWYAVGVTRAERAAEIEPGSEWDQIGKFIAHRYLFSPWVIVILWKVWMVERELPASLFYSPLRMKTWAFYSKSSSVIKAFTLVLRVSLRVVEKSSERRMPHVHHRMTRHAIGHGQSRSILNCVRSGRANKHEYADKAHLKMTLKFAFQRAVVSKVSPWKIVTELQTCKILIIWVLQLQQSQMLVSFCAQNGHNQYYLHAH